MNVSTIKNQYESINLSKLPANVKTEVENIKADTENFTDADLVEVFADNWTLLYNDVIKKKYAEALEKPKAKSQNPISKSPKKESKTNSQRTLESLIKTFVAVANNEKKGTDAPSANEHKYKLGDKYRSDFDYWGMLTVAASITPETNIQILEKLYDSLEDVNYHTINSTLWDIIQLKKQKANSPQIPHKKEQKAKKAAAKYKPNKARSSKSNIKNPISKNKKENPCPEPTKKKGKPTPAKGKKKEYGENYPTGVKVRTISEDARLLKRVSAALGKERKLSTLANIYNAFTKYVAEHKITKTSTHARLILEAMGKMQQVIAKAAKAKLDQDDLIIFDLTDADLKADIKTAAEGTKAYPSVSLFKSFANMQGKMNVGMAGRRSSLKKRIEKALKDKKVVGKDPFYKELKQILTILTKTKDNEVIPPLEIGLGSVNSANTLAGIMGYLGCAGYQEGQCPCSKKDEGLGKVDLPNPKQVLEQVRAVKDAATGFKQTATEIGQELQDLVKPEGSATPSIMDNFIHGEEIDNVQPKGKVFRLPGELGNFFGPIEDYEMSIILRGDSGAGKTRLTFRMADAFASMGKRVLYNTLEIGVYSDLIKRMKTDYIKPHNVNKITWNGETMSFTELNEVAGHFDVVFVDSYGKLKEMDRDSIDELKRNNPNTIFVFIFQSNSKGTSLGGPGSEYDGGIVVHVVTVKENKALNYAKLEKNRYSGDDVYYLLHKDKTINHEQLDQMLNPSKKEAHPAQEDC